LHTTTFCLIHPHSPLPNSMLSCATHLGDSRLSLLASQPTASGTPAAPPSPELPCAHQPSGMGGRLTLRTRLASELALPLRSRTHSTYIELYSETKWVYVIGSNINASPAFTVSHTQHPEWRLSVGHRDKWVSV
jgi:hypothetical protein